MEMTLLEQGIAGVSAGLAFLIGRRFLKIRATRQYFEKKNVPFHGRALNLFKLATGKAKFVQEEDELYRFFHTNKCSIVGTTDISATKTWVIKDMEVMKKITVKDFEYFVNRRPLGRQSSSKNSPNKFLHKMVTFMHGQEWNATRKKIVHAFNTNRIISMFASFEHSSQKMEEYIKKHYLDSSRSGEVDLCQIVPKYSLDVIASCVFGVDSKSFEVEPGKMSDFEKMAHTFGFHFNSPRFMLRLIFVLAASDMAEALNVGIFDAKAEQYFVEILREQLKQRRENGAKRDDFLQVMMDAAEKFRIKVDENKGNTRVIMRNRDQEVGVNNPKDFKANVDNEGAPFILDDDHIVANAMLFINAGFDTSQSLILMIAYCLATEPEVQEKLYKEVSSVLETHGGKMSYKAISQMSYLDMAMKETLRLHCPTTRAERVCGQNYRIAAGKDNVAFEIEKGDVVIFPIRGIHRDFNYYTDPEKFMPERFSTVEGKGNAFIPFGRGPRLCMGQKFAQIKVKTAIAHISKSFRLECCSNTKIPPEFGNDPVIKPKSCWLKVTARD